MNANAKKNGELTSSGSKTLEVYREAEKFMGLLNVRPLGEDVQINRQAGGSRYLPVSFIEMKLDEIFFGLWQTKVIQQPMVIANEITCIIELSVFHPVVKTWITRSGFAAVMIQQKKGADITDISAKHKNTLVKDFPHLKAECIKNAAKSFGKLFGRDLNREFEDTYNSFLDTVETANNESEGLKEQLQKAKKTEDLTRIYQENHGTVSNNEILLDLFIRRKAELTK